MIVARRRSPRAARGLLRLAVTGSLALVACGDATAPLPSSGVPREFRVSSVGGFVASASDVRLVGDTLVYVVARYTRGGIDSTVTRRVPTADDWRAFWRAADGAGVRRWAGECSRSDIADAGGFSFTLAWDGGRRTGSYVGAFPTRDGTCADGYTAEAQAFSDAVDQLLGVARAL